jgi:hypothetical protein
MDEADTPEPCATEEWRDDKDGRCVEPGLPEMPCPPGEWLRDGVCLPAGVPPDGCAEGFTHDGDRGCFPILPASCPPGLMAVPGEARCREVAPCAPGRFGDIPVEPSTEHVDASYAGIDSDGSADKPWSSIQAAVNAAAPGAIVAIAAGSYVEDVIVSGKPVRLWGVCPRLVEIAGFDLAVKVQEASGSVVKNLAIRGAGDGFASSGSVDVLVEQVWVHDNGLRGVSAQNDLGVTAVTLRNALVEGNTDGGVFVSGSEATLERTVVRGTKPNAQGNFGRGVTAQSHTVNGAPATLVMRTSLVEQNHDIGVNISGSQATVEASVIVATQPDGQGRFGHGLSVIADVTTGAPSLLQLTTSVIEQNRYSGVHMEASEATIESTVIRANQLDPQGAFGHGVNAQAHPETAAATKLLLRTSLIDQNHDVGLFVAGSDSTVEATAVRNTLPDAALEGGRGIAVQAHRTTGRPSNFTLTSSLVDHNQEIGIFIEGSNVTIDGCLVRDTLIDAEGKAGRGVNVQPHWEPSVNSQLTLVRSIVERSTEVGVFVVDAQASIEHCLIRDTLVNSENLYGDGVGVISILSPAAATVASTRIERSERAALAAFGAYAGLSRSALVCQAIDIDGEPALGSDFVIEDIGANLCGCPDADHACKAMTANLGPPAALEPEQN